MVAEPPLPGGALDLTVDRSGTHSRKVQGRQGAFLGRDIVPMWVADMDFRSPQPIVDALVARAAHGVYGYTDPPKQLEEALVERLRTVYGCTAVEPDASWFRWLPGLISGLNHAAKVACPPSRPGTIVIPTPVYAPFLATPDNVGASLKVVPLVAEARGADGELHYEIDWAALEAALAEPDARLLQWCNPHNPVGRCWTRADLERAARLCVAHDVLVCSDEVWGELPLQPSSAPFVSMLGLLDVPGLRERLIVLTSPSKAFNVATLDVAVAVVPGDSLRSRLRAAGADAAEVTCFGYTAATAAYADAESERWRQRLVDYLLANRDHAVQALAAMDGVKFVVPESSYLLWIDATEALPAGADAQDFFFSAGVGLTGGVTFGGGKGTCRLNFGCKRATLDEALRRMGEALRAVP